MGFEVRFSIETAFDVEFIDQTIKPSVSMPASGPWEYSVSDSLMHCNQSPQAPREVHFLVFPLPG